MVVYTFRLETPEDIVHTYAKFKEIYEQNDNEENALL